MRFGVHERHGSPFAREQRSLAGVVRIYPGVKTLSIADVQRAVGASKNVGVEHYDDGAIVDER